MADDQRPNHHQRCLSPLLRIESCEDIWYGHPDIVLVPPIFSNIPLWFFEDDIEAQMQEDDDLLRKDLLQEDNRSINISELKLKMVLEKCAEQILSQAITFSFCEANSDYSGGRERHTLIPSIVLTPHHYLVVMYDYENDILLSSGYHQISLYGMKQV
ncbi:AP3M [Mytilus coruscus]|uniref:AP3M n=1 Tax=Mytilus coruscus TaxID=42192 RepID=A0A6J8EYZ6_MYTCO|nr:AP3M [Mytilus coruscus]